MTETSIARSLQLVWTGVSKEPTENQIPAPSAFSKLFTARRPNEALTPVAMTGSLNATDQNLVMTFPDGRRLHQITGVEIIQDDLDLALELLHRALQKDEAALQADPDPKAKGEKRVPVEISLRELLLTLNPNLTAKDISAPRIEALKASARRLAHSSFEIHHNDEGGRTKIIQSVRLLGFEIAETYQDSTVFYIYSSLKTLFDSTGFTYQSLVIRRQLRKDPLARWLYTYYCQYEVPPLRTEAWLKEACGRSKQRPETFRTNLAKALAALANEAGWNITYDQAAGKITVDRGKGLNRLVRAARPQLNSQAAVNLAYALVKRIPAVRFAAAELAGVDPRRAEEPRTFAETCNRLVAAGKGVKDAEGKVASDDAKHYSATHREKAKLSAKFAQARRFSLLNAKEKKQRRTKRSTD